MNIQSSCGCGACVKGAHWSNVSFDLHFQMPNREIEDKKEMSYIIMIGIMSRMWNIKFYDHTGELPTYGQKEILKGS